MTTKINPTTAALNALTEKALTFDTSIGVTVCSRQGDEAVLKAAMELGGIMNNFSSQAGIGGWNGELRQETERNMVVTVWGPSAEIAHHVIGWATGYQAWAQQESVAVTIHHPKLPGGWLAVIVFDNAGWEALDNLATELWPAS